MHLLENFREGLRSIKANLLRSVFTAIIIALGIFALVGVLTAVSGIESAITKSLSSLGASSFDITSRYNRGDSQEGVTEKNYPPVRFNEISRFVRDYQVPAVIAVSARVTQIAEVKRLSKKTNPNVFVNGVNEGYFPSKTLEFDMGRNFSALEVEKGAPVAIIGHKIYTTLYKNNEPIEGTTITFSGAQFRVIGALKEKGGFGDPSSNFDNMVFIPVIKGNQLSGGRGLRYRLTVNVNDPTQMESAMGEATGLMRRIRGDQVGNPNSFELERSETLAELEDLTGRAQMVGFIIGIITLLGASIALMNIMLVSVTERTREIGVRKALGATPQRIMEQFIMEAIVVCLIGGISGIVLGIIGGNLASKALNGSFVVPWAWMITGFIICIGVGLLSGYYPARKAARLDPIESLRFE